MRTLTSRERRIVALGLLALLIWLAWYVLIERAFLAPLHEISAAQALLQERERHYSDIIAHEDALTTALAATRKDPTLRAGLLSGEDPNAVAADLMQQVLDRVEDYADVGPGCEVTQRMPMAAASQAAAAPYRQVRVSLSLECAIEPLEEVLHDLEYGQPSLFIDQISIRRPEKASSGAGPGRLKVQLLVVGYMSAADAQEGDT